MKKCIALIKGTNLRARIAAIITLALAVAALLCVIISASTAINGAIEDVPIMQLVLDRDEFNELERRGEYIAESIELFIDEDYDDMLDEIKDQTGLSPKRMMKLCDPMSMRGQLAIHQLNEDEEGIAGMIVMIAFVIVLAVLVGFFALLSGLLSSRGLMITANMVSMLFYFIFAGFAGFLIFSALCVAYTIFVSYVCEIYKKGAYLDNTAPTEEAAEA